MDLAITRFLNFTRGSKSVANAFMIFGAKLQSNFLRNKSKLKKSKIAHTKVLV